MAFIPRIGYVHDDIELVQKAVMNSRSYKEIPTDRIDVSLLQKGQFLPWQSNVIQYFSYHGNSIGLFMQSPGSGKSGMLAGLAEYHKRSERDGGQSVVMDYLLGRSAYVQHAISLTTNNGLIDQQREETVRAYSEPGDYVASNKAMAELYRTEKLRGDKSRMQIVSKELSEFYDFSTYQRFIGNNIGKKVRSILTEGATGKRFSISKGVAFRTVSDPRFAEIARSVFDNTILLMDEVTSILPSGPLHQEFIGQCVYDALRSKENKTEADHQVIRDIEVNNWLLADDIFAREMGTLTKRNDKWVSLSKANSSKATSQFQTFYWFLLSLSKARGVRLYCASATPMKNEESYRAFSGILSMFAFVIGETPVVPTSKAINEFVRTNLSSRIGYMAQLSSSIPVEVVKQDSAPILWEGTLIERSNVVVPLGLYQGIKHMANIRGNKVHGGIQGRDRKGQAYSCAIFPNGSANARTPEGFIFTVTQYASGSKLIKGGVAIRKPISDWDIVLANAVNNPWYKETKVMLNNPDVLALYSGKYSYLLGRMERIRLQMQKDFPNTANKFGLGSLFIYMEPVVYTGACWLTQVMANFKRPDHWDQDPDLEWEFFNPKVRGSALTKQWVRTYDGEIRINTDVMKPKNRVAIYTSDTSKIVQRLILNILRSPDNINGQYLKAVIITQTGQEGISVRGCLHGFKLNAGDSKSAEEQIDGRISRADGQDSILAAIRKNGDDPRKLRLTYETITSQIQPGLLQGLWHYDPYSLTEDFQVPGISPLENVNKFLGVLSPVEVQTLRDAKWLFDNTVAFPGLQRVKELRGSEDYDLYFGCTEAIYMTSDVLAEKVRQYGQGNMEALMDLLKGQAFDRYLNRTLLRENIPYVEKTNKDQRLYSITKRQEIADNLLTLIMSLTSQTHYIHVDILVKEAKQAYQYSKRTVIVGLLYITHNRMSRNAGVSYYPRVFKDYIYVTSDFVPQPTNSLSMKMTFSSNTTKGKSVADILSGENTLESDIVSGEVPNVESVYGLLSADSKARIVEQLPLAEYYSNPQPPLFEWLQSNNIPKSMQSFLNLSRYEIHYGLPRNLDGRWDEAISYQSGKPIRRLPQGTEADLIAHSFQAKKNIYYGNRAALNNVVGYIKLYDPDTNTWRRVSDTMERRYKNYILERRRTLVHSYEVDKNAYAILVPGEPIKVRHPDREDIETSIVDKRAVKYGILMDNLSANDIVQAMYSLGHPIIGNGFKELSFEEGKQIYGSRIKQSGHLLRKHFPMVYERDLAPEELKLAIVSWFYTTGGSVRSLKTRRSMLQALLTRKGRVVDWGIELYLPLM